MMAFERLRRQAHDSRPVEMIVAPVAPRELVGSNSPLSVRSEMCGFHNQSTVISARPRG